MQKEKKNKRVEMLLYKKWGLHITLDLSLLIKRGCRKYKETTQETEMKKGRGKDRGREGDC